MNDHYFTPGGLFVMTEAAHHARGYCCGNACLHCPYEFEAVTDYPSVRVPVTVRRARPTDAPELALLARQTFVGTYRKYQRDLGRNLVPYLTTSFALDKIAASIVKSDNAWWVAEDALGKLWGYAKLSSEAREGQAPGGRHLQRIYVRRQAQGHHLGRRLLQEVEAFAKTRHARAIWLTTLTAERAAQDFYPKLGYRKVEDVVFTLGTQDFELSVMEKVV